MKRTLADKIWAAHTVERLDNGNDLLFVDRHFIHEVTSPQAFASLRARQRDLAHRDLTVSIEDHLVSTAPGRSGAGFAAGEALIEHARSNAQLFGLRHFHATHPDQGIVHVMAPEQGMVLPGMLVVCGDSHTCTLGALGAMAFGIGTSEVEHVLATQVLVQKKPGNIRVNITGRPLAHITAKDVILSLCRRLRCGIPAGSAIEYAGSYVDALAIDGRFTLCNMSVEMGARIGLIGPDAVTFSYLERVAGDALRVARPMWEQLRSDADAVFADEVALDVSRLAPQISWGITPHQSMDIDGCVPAQHSSSDMRAYEYMGLAPGEQLLGKQVDVVFIGSCANSRIDDLRLAAAAIRGRRVASHVRAYVVPGSQQVKRLAEQEGHAEVFERAGFEWREPGCSMCVGINGEQVPPRQRCLSTSNRNFVGRQGPDARTHLVSPLVAVLSALEGAIVDPRAESELVPPC